MTPDEMFCKITGSLPATGAELSDEARASSLREAIDEMLLEIKDYTEGRGELRHLIMAALGVAAAAASCCKVRQTWGIDNGDIRASCFGGQE